MITLDDHLTLGTHAAHVVEGLKFPAGHTVVDIQILNASRSITTPDDQNKSGTHASRVVGGLEFPAGHHSLDTQARHASRSTTAPAATRPSLPKRETPPRRTILASQIHIDTHGKRAGEPLPATRASSTSKWSASPEIYSPRARERTHSKHSSPVGASQGGGQGSRDSQRQRAVALSTRPLSQGQCGLQITSAGRATQDSRFGQIRSAHTHTVCVGPAPIRSTS